MTSIMHMKLNCPNCEASYTDYEVMSTNNFSTIECSTDSGYLRASEKNHYELKTCHECRKVFWSSDGRNRAYLTDREPTVSWNEAPTFGDAIEFAKSLSDPADVVNVRLNAWRHLRFRADPRLVELNMRELLHLLDEDSDDERILKAEIARNVREFDLCIKVLAQVSMSGDLKHAQRIRELAERKVSHVSIVVNDSINIPEDIRKTLRESLGEIYDEFGEVHIEENWPFRMKS